MSQLSMENMTDEELKVLCSVVFKKLRSKSILVSTLDFCFNEMESDEVLNVLTGLSRCFKSKLEQQKYPIVDYDCYVV